MKTYLFRRWIDGAWYSGRVACRDWQDADEWCRRAGAHLDGELIASIPAVVPGIVVRAAVRVRNWFSREETR